MRLLSGIDQTVRKYFLGGIKYVFKFLFKLVCSFPSYIKRSVRHLSGGNKNELFSNGFITALLYGEQWYITMTVLCVLPHRALSDLFFLHECRQCPVQSLESVFTSDFCRVSMSRNPVKCYFVVFGHRVKRPRTTLLFSSWGVVNFEGTIIKLKP